MRTLPSKFYEAHISLMLKSDEPRAKKKKKKSLIHILCEYRDKRVVPLIEQPRNDKVLEMENRSAAARV